MEFSVSLNTKEVIEMIKQNKLQHREIFLEAIEAYRLKAIEVLNDFIDKVKANEPIHVYVSLQRPEDHSDDYDRIINMLEMHTENTIQMGEQDYSNFIQDEWSWSKQFLNTASTYTGKQYR